MHFIYLLVICTSFENSVQFICLFINWFFCTFVLNFLIFLHFLYIDPFLMSSWQNFSHSVGFLFTLQFIPLTCRSFLIWGNSICQSCYILSYWNPISMLASSSLSFPVVVSKVKPIWSVVFCFLIWSIFIDYFVLMISPFVRMGYWSHIQFLCQC
jgi:hypothetical protein